MSYVIIVLVILSNGQLQAGASEETYPTLQSCEAARQIRADEVASLGLEVVASQCTPDKSGRDA